MNSGFELPSERVDERDTTFARMARVSGTVPYEEYYGRRPELREADDRVRAQPALGTPGGLYYDAALMAETNRYFAAIPEFVPEESEVDRLSKEIAGGDPTDALRSASLRLGAVDAGAAHFPPSLYYTRKGRLDEDYGRPVAADLPHALVFLVEMQHGEMRRAPEAETLRESARQYLRAARIARTLEAALSRAGHRAYAHYDAHYEAILPPLAVAAGLGEVGRNNILISRRWGSRVRIGAVGTDLPLVPSRPISVGAEGFCAVCRKCAENCPAGALSRGDRERINGVWKWPSDTNRCYRFWRAAGTDCGVCMAVCPFSHRDSVWHNLVRWAVRRLPWIHRAAVLGDDLLYGRRWKPGPRVAARAQRIP